MNTYIQRWLRVSQARRRGVVRWHGVNLYFPQHSVVANSILKYGCWEPEIAALLDVSIRDGTTMLDVGANIGASVIPLLSKFESLRVVSFEPSPTVLPSLIRTRDTSQFKNRWEIVTKAATAVGGQEVTFTRFPGRGGDVYDGLKDTGRAGRGIELKVATTTIDIEWEARSRPQISVIKIDVEGGEIGVLEGARKCMATCRPVIITEWYPKNFTAYGISAGRVLDVAEESGYATYVLPELSPISDRRLFEFQMATRENLLLLPKAKD